MTRYVIAFEVAGLLLTVALVGAIAIAHREEVEPAPSREASRNVIEAASAVPAGGSGVRAGDCQIVTDGTRGSLISRPRFAPAVRRRARPAVAGWFDAKELMRWTTTSR